MAQEPTELHVRKLVEQRLGGEVRSVRRVRVGLVNFVFVVRRKNLCSVVARLTNERTQRFSAGGAYWNQALSRIGLPVPRLLSYGEDSLGFSHLLFAYERGTELEQALPTLTPATVRMLAAEVLTCQRIVHSLGEGTRFGWAFSRQSFLFPSLYTWDAFVELLLEHTRRRYPTLPHALWRKVQTKFHSLRKILRAVRPLPFLDDASTRNVLVLDGRLGSILDTDTICYGDPLYAVGLTKFRSLYSGIPLRYAEELRAGRSEHLVNFYALTKCVGELARLGSVGFNGLLLQESRKKRERLEAIACGL